MREPYMPRARAWVAREVAPSPKAAPGTAAAAIAAAPDAKTLLSACALEIGWLDDIVIELHSDQEEIHRGMRQVRAHLEKRGIHEGNRPGYMRTCGEMWL